MIDRLEAKGWVERRGAERRPARQARLSHAGSRARAQAHLAHRRSDRRRRAGRSLGAGERAADAAARAREEEPRRGRRRACRPERRWPRRGRASARTATTGASRRESGSAPARAVRRAGAGDRRRADVLAAGRPLRRRPRTPSSRPTSRRSPARSRAASSRCACATTPSVAAGDVLLRLDPEPYRLALAKADAEVDSARSTVEQLKVSLRETRADVEGSREPAVLSGDCRRSGSASSPAAA